PRVSLTSSASLPPAPPGAPWSFLTLGNLHPWRQKGLFVVASYRSICDPTRCGRMPERAAGRHVPSSACCTVDLCRACEYRGDAASTVARGSPNELHRCGSRQMTD